MRISDIQIRDPFVVLEDNTYYLFGSTDKDIWKSRAVGFDFYTSNADLTSFEGPFPAFRPAADFWSETNFWAPEVHRFNGAYYMFATFKPKEGRRGTAILKSDAGIRGPYQPWSLTAAGVPGPVTPAEWECLDGTFFIERGKPYLVFCHEWQQIGDGHICAMPLTDDLRQAAFSVEASASTGAVPSGEGEGASTVSPKILFRASEAPWAYPLQGRAPGSYVTDGPFMHRTKDGALLILWSSFGEDGRYCIGTARSQDGTLNGPWLQSPEPLYSADGGHGMLFRSKEGSASVEAGLYLAIHTPNKTPLERPIFVEITEGGDTITAQTGKIIS
ncbi:glycosyl hydrolase family 43 [Spirochaetia bacterium]|nr:glycosyl hydrolase family 43 [Spirochaetia bacterium]